MLKTEDKRWIAVPVWLITAIVVLCTGHWLLAQTTAPAEPTPESTDMTFLQLLIKGGWFMVPIAITSLIGLALILERMLALRRRRIIPSDFMRRLKQLGDNREAALAYCHGRDCPIARIIAVGIRKLPQGPESVEQAIEDAGANEVHKLRRNLRMLYGVSAVAPMLGLLGTVWGMIEAFRVTSAIKGIGKPEVLAKGIYEALVTTLAGLMVAIPVLMFYYFFMAKIERLITEMNDASEEFVQHMTAPVELTAHHGAHGEHGEKSG